MEFIVTRFIRMLERDYNFIIKTDIDAEEKTNTVIIKKLNNEFRNFLLRLRYSPVTGQSVVRNSNGDVIRTDIIRGKARICSPYGNNGVTISFNENNYGEFINILDYNIRRYFENHSQIDEINHRS